MLVTDEAFFTSNEIKSKDKEKDIKQYCHVFVSCNFIKCHRLFFRNSDLFPGFSESFLIPPSLQF